ncbi:exostosin family protein [Hymenobacter sp. RP-2-7]|uniref:Exostosin family protein n=1 Tax=Hymenobacter polaris TaxID=2682546 RepID=A0A7Y0AFZ6_9BACT|nr:exostosin family protein [Hymenobacter polaris]NML66653.1 exostosin family protein [Hymenobacter polaris]
MKNKFKLYTDLSLLKIGRYVQMLIPFMSDDIAKQESRIVEAGRFDDYIKFGRNFIELTSIEECDACLLPIYYDLSANRRSFEESIQDFLDKVGKANKKLLIFAGHDVANVAITIKNSIVFTSAIDKSSQANNEQSWPHFFEDFLKKYTEGNIIPRSRGITPVIGFCGYAPPLNVSFGKEKIISGIKLITNYLGLIQKYPDKISHSYRARAIIGLQRSSKIAPNFVLKSNFAFGPSGLNSGKVTESNADFRRIFVENILNSDYTLCVRGIGNNSIRFFETICCGRIPVFVDTDSVLPYDSVINWRELCVWVAEKDVDRIDEVVANFHRSISDEDFIALQKRLRNVWEEYLSPTGFFKNLHLLINS